MAKQAFEEMADAAKERLGQTISDIGAGAKEKMSDATEGAKARAAEVFGDKKEVAAEVAAGKEREGRLELPKQVLETFSEKGKEIYDFLSSDAKEFTRNLYEKIKSSDIVQGIVDRYHVWKDGRLGERAERKASKLNVKKEMELNDAKISEDTALQRQESFAKLESVMRRMSQEVDPKAREEAQKEIDGHRAKAEAARSKAQNFESEFKEIATKKEAHEGKVNVARERIDGRLEVKMARNSEAIEKLLPKQQVLEKERESFVLELRDLRDRKYELQVILEELPKKSAVGKIAKTQIASIEKKEKEIEKSQGKIGREIDAVYQEISGLKGKNEDLQRKRDDLNPEKGKQKEGGEKQKKEEKEKGTEKLEGKVVEYEARFMTAKEVVDLWNQEEGGRDSRLLIELDFRRVDEPIVTKGDGWELLLTLLANDDVIERAKRKLGKGVLDKVERFVEENIVEEERVAERKAA